MLDTKIYKGFTCCMYTYILQSAHQIVAHGGEAPGRIVTGIVVPGNDIHFLCPLEIVKELIGAHQIGSNGNILDMGTNSIPL